MLLQTITKYTKCTGTLTPRELDPEVGTLEDSNESNGPNILYPGDNWYVSDGFT